MSLASLKIRTEEFKEDPISHLKLNNLKSAWLDCAVTWKRSSLFEFGPVDKQFVLEGIYSNPDIAAIEAIIANGLTPIDSSYVQGLGQGHTGILALEYLIYRDVGVSNVEIINSFTLNGSNGRRLDYLAALVAALQYYSDQALFRWSRGGENYVQEFIQSDGSDRNSSLGIVVNRMTELASLIRNERVGRPNGLFNGGVPQPDALDGSRSDHSLELLRGELDAIRSTFLGFRSASTNAVGINYLLNIVAGSSNNESLGILVGNQIDSVFAKVHAIKIPMSQALLSERQLISDLYLSVEKLDHLIKNDMGEALRL